MREVQSLSELNRTEQEASISTLNEIEMVVPATPSCHETVPTVEMVPLACPSPLLRTGLVALLPASSGEGDKTLIREHNTSEYC